MSKYVRCASAGLVLWGCLMTPVSAEDKLTPATFIKHKKIATSEFECPNVPREIEKAAIYCAVDVLATGAIDELSISCRAENKYKELADITSKKLNELAFKPAAVSGIATAVNVNLRVLYKHLDGVCTSVTVLNNGHKAKEYGPDYIAPQEIIVGDDFIQDYTQAVRKAFVNHNIRNVHDAYVDAVTLTINSGGSVEAISFQPKYAKLDLKRVVRSTLKGRRFIPGQSKDQNAKMELLLPTGGASVLGVSSYSDEVIILKE